MFKLTPLGGTKVPGKSAINRSNLITWVYLGDDRPSFKSFKFLALGYTKSQNLARYFIHALYIIKLFLQRVST